MKIIFKKVEDLIPYINNSRTHSEDQILQVAASIKEFGFTNPVLVDGSNGIIAGHGRVQAAKKIGLDSVPTIELSSLSESQKKAYIIADNKLAMNARWNEEILRIELENLKLDGFDITLTGFEDDFLTVENGPEVDPEEPEEVDIVEPETQRGDVWILGESVLMCGNSTSQTDIDSLVGTKDVGLVIFDPPYEVEECWNAFFDCEKYLVFTDYKHIREAMRVALQKEYIYQFVWDGCTSWYTGKNRPLARHKTAFYCSDDGVWGCDLGIYHDDKKREPKTVKNTRGSCDYAPLPNGGVRLQTVFQEPNAGQKDEDHGHTKPIKWITALIRGSNPKGNILDLFGGGGTTLFAAEDRPVLMMELDPVQCDKIKNRWEKWSGKKAIRAEE